MDVSTIDDVIYWINRQPGWDLVSADEVIVRSETRTSSRGEGGDSVAAARGWQRALVAEVAS